MLSNWLRLGFLGLAGEQALWLEQGAEACAAFSGLDGTAAALSLSDPLHTWPWSHAWSLGAESDGSAHHSVLCILFVRVGPSSN